jgi:hypothetical protein
MRHPARVSQVGFSANGAIIVSAASDGLRSWDAATGLPFGETILLEQRSDRRDSTTGDSASVTVSWSPAFSKIVTATQERVVRVWPARSEAESEKIPTVNAAVISWARNLAGLGFKENGELYVIPDGERLPIIASSSLPPGPWTDLAAWINTPAPHRKIDPKSKFTTRQIAERERDFDGDGNLESLESALRFDPTVPLVHLFLAAAMEKEDASKQVENRDHSIYQRAAFLRRYDLDALAREEGKMEKEELAALWIRAANHLATLSPDTKVGAGPRTTTAREEALRAAQKAVELNPQSSAAGEVLKKIQAAKEPGK